MRNLFFVLALLSCGLAHAQTLTFTAETTTGNGSVVPVLTWSTSPPAGSCTASGDAAWTGSKPASGTATLAAINVSKTYNLACTWAADDRAVLNWINPTLNTNGTPYTDPKEIKVVFGPAANDLSQTRTVTHTSTTATVSPLTAGTWFFSVRAVNLLGIESANAEPIVSKVITSGANQTRSVGITVNPVPNAPTGLTIQ